MNRSFLQKLAFSAVLLAAAGLVSWLLVRTGDQSITVGAANDVAAAPGEVSAPLSSNQSVADGDNSTNGEKTTGRPSAQELKERFERASGKLDGAKEKVTNLNGELPDVSDQRPDPAEIRRKIEDNIRRYHEKVTSPEYQKDKEDAGRLRTLRKLAEDSESAFNGFSKAPDDPEVLNEAALRKEFEAQYLSAFDKFFDSTSSSGEEEGSDLFQLLSDVASYGGYTLDGEPELTARVLYALKWGTASFPIRNHALTYDKTVFALPLNPRRGLGLWSTPEEVNSRVGKWANRTLSIVRLNVLTEFVVTASLDLGCDAVHEAALAVIESMRSSLPRWASDQREVGAMLLAHSLPDLTAVLFAGSSSESLATDLETLQQTAVALAWEVRRDKKERAAETEVLAALRKVRLFASKTVLRAKALARVEIDGLDEGADQLSIQEDAPALDSETFANCVALTADWKAAASLYPAIRWLGAATDKAKQADLTAFRQLLAAGEFTQEMKDEVGKLGALVVPALVDALSSAKESAVVRAAVQTYDLLSDVTAFEEANAILTSQDNRDFRAAIANHVAGLLDQRYSDRKAAMPSLTSIARATSASLHDDRHFTTVASYDDGHVLADVLVAIMLVDGAGPSVLFGDVTGTLGWQSAEHAPRTLACVRDQGLAKQFLKASVSLQGKSWAESGSFMGSVLERLAGMRIKSDEDRQNPKVWLALLGVEPDFHMFD